MTESTAQEPLYFTLPGRLLAACWLVLVALNFVGWLVVAPAMGETVSEVRAGLTGGLLSMVVGGGSLVLISPWKPRPSEDLPTLWLAVTVARVLVTPVVALLLYFAARPATGPYVLGIGSAYLGLLFLETTVIVLDMRRQFESVGPRPSRPAS